MSHTPLTGFACGCKRGIQRDNCPNCEGTGKAIDFRAIHARREKVAMSQSKGKWTPGPWRIIHLSRTETQKPMETIQRVQLVNAGRAAAIVEGVCCEEWDANARLIAAAPQMVEAIQEMIAAWDHPTRESVKMRANAIHSLRAALAAAEGRDREGVRKWR